MSTVAKIALIVAGLVLLLPGLCSLACTALWLSDGAPSLSRQLNIILPFWIPGLLLGGLGIFLIQKVVRRRSRAGGAG